MFFLSRNIGLAFAKHCFILYETLTQPCGAFRHSDKYSYLCGVVMKNLYFLTFNIS